MQRVIIYGTYVGAKVDLERHVVNRVFRIDL